jgi:hypothetical protein
MMSTEVAWGIVERCNYNGVILEGMEYYGKV